MTTYQKSLSRRKFLQMTSGMAAGSLLAACQPVPTPSPTLAPPAATQAPAATPAPKQPIKLRWWTGVADINGPSDTVKAWNAANPDIQVEHVQYSNNDEGNLKLDTALLVSGEVDIPVTSGFNRWKKRIDAGLLEPLDNYLQGFDVDKEFGKLPTKIDGKTWGFIAYAQPFFVFINKKMFEENNIAIPKAWTWDEFRDVGMKLTKGSGAQKRYGSFIAQTIRLRWVDFIKGGDWIFKDKCATAFDDPLAVRMMEQRIQFESVDKFSLPYAEAKAGKLVEQNEFFLGRVGMLVVAAYVLRHVKNVKDLPRDFQTTFAPLPTFKDIPYNYAPGVVDDMVSVTAKCKYKDAAYKFAKWHATEGYMYMTQFGRTGTWKGQKPEDLIKAYQSDFPDFQKHVDADALKPIYINDKAFPVPTNMTANNELTQILNEEVEKAFLGEIKPAEAAANMKKRGDEILAKVCK